MSFVYGVNERVGLEGLDRMDEQRRRTSTPETRMDALVEIDIEWPTKRFTAHRDTGVIEGWNPRGGAWTANDDLP